MAIRSLSDFNAAFAAGKFHVQRFQKNAGTAHAKVWADPSYASGQQARRRRTSHCLTPIRTGMPEERCPLRLP